MSGRLAGKRTIIVGAGQTTGTTTGNGRAMAMRFAQEGAELLLVDRDATSLEETRALVGAAAANLLCDIADDDGPRSIAAAAEDRWGGADVLVNNVGIGRGRALDGPVDTLDEGAFDVIMDVNLRAMWRTIKYVLPLLRRDGGGAIVNISSLAAIAPARMLSYSLSKVGVNRLTQTVAYLEAPNAVRCNAVLPGMIDTPMAIGGIALREGLDPAAIRAARDRAVPMGRMGEAIDTANAALFLASDEAKFITGVLLPVDGGAAVRVAG